ncbi:MAG: DUF2185 domain-containing protein [Anaerovoracaceae bacterium]
MDNLTFKNYMETEIDEFRKSVSDLKNDVEYTRKKEFQVLLAAVHSLIKQNNFTSIKLVDRNGVPADRKKVSENLTENFRITETNSANRAIGNICFRGTQWQFVQFERADDPEFSVELEKLSSKGKDVFNKSKEFALLCRDITGANGFVAWDFALGTDIIRECVLCDYFDEPTAFMMIEDLTKVLLKAFDNWVDYAVSFITGGTYSAYKNSNFDLHEAKQSFDYMLENTKRLFLDENCNVWKRYAWYKSKEYFPTLNKDDLKALVKSEQACFVSDRISLDGAKPCYVYREKPFKNFPDSGWRFFAGDESREFCADPENSNIFKLNVIANFDESIIPLLDSEINTAFIRKDGEDFVNFKTASDAMKMKASEDMLY